MPIGTERAAVLASDLDDILSVPRMQRAWKRSVRQGLRNQALEDLHDHLDVHRHVEPFLRAVRAEALAGTYRPSTPEVILLEKRDGICRRLMMPCPADAIVLQTVIDTLETRVRDKQPHDNAFYSRSHTRPTIEDVDATFAYPWWILWPQFQEKIWGFTKAHPYLVVTDIANYFDCIPLSILRNVISSMSEFSENILNFLFYMLESFTWRPFYMPHSGVGLPQIDFDAPRLLAHAFLFRADTELHRATNGDFVRWMDDMNCGVESPEEARHLLGRLETVLNSLGLRLNSGKTQVLSGKEAAGHFWIQENRTLSILNNLIVNGTGTAASHQRIGRTLRRRFRVFNKAERQGHWDKVFKRYLNLFGKVGDPSLHRYGRWILSERPGLREALFRYYARLGFGRSRFEQIHEYMTGGNCSDDVSVFRAAKTLISWKTPVRGPTRSAVVSLVREISRENRVTVSRLTAALWLVAKYGSDEEIWNLLESTRKTWSRSTWAARQVAAVTTRLTQERREEIYKQITASGLLEPLRVLANLEVIRSLQVLDKQLTAYLHHRPPAGAPYPLPKILIAFTVLQGTMPFRDRQELKRTMMSYLVDGHYRKLIRSAKREKETRPALPLQHPEHMAVS